MRLAHWSQKPLMILEQAAVSEAGSGDVLLDSSFSMLILLETSVKLVLGGPCIFISCYFLKDQVF